MNDSKEGSGQHRSDGNLSVFTEVADGVSIHNDSLKLATIFAGNGNEEANPRTIRLANLPEIYVRQWDKPLSADSLTGEDFPPNHHKRDQAFSMLAQTGIRLTNEFDSEVQGDENQLVLTIRRKPSAEGAEHLSTHIMNSDVAMVLFKRSEVLVNVYAGFNDNALMDGAKTEQAGAHIPAKELVIRVAEQQVAISKLCEDFRATNDPTNDMQLELFIHLLESALARLKQIDNGIGDPVFEQELADFLTKEGRRLTSVDDVLEAGERIVRNVDRGAKLWGRVLQIARRLFDSGSASGPDGPTDAGDYGA